MNGKERSARTRHNGQNAVLLCVCNGEHRIRFAVTCQMRCLIIPNQTHALARPKSGSDLPPFLTPFLCPLRQATRNDHARVQPSLISLVRYLPSAYPVRLANFDSLILSSKENS